MSIFELITELCDKHIDKRKCMNESINISTINKKLRSKAFEILLKKKHLTGCNNELEDIKDPICQLLAWQYTLKNDLNLSKKAAALGAFIKDLENNEHLKDPVVQNVILFLLHLKGSKSLQEENDSKYSLLDRVNLKYKAHTENTALPYDLYPQNIFHFPDPPSTKDPKCLTIFSLNSFKSTPYSNLSLSKKPPEKFDPVLKYSNFTFPPILGDNKAENDESENEFISDEGYVSPVKSGYPGKVWKLVSKLPVNEHRTWESLDNIDPEKELPFACEAGGNILHLFQKILKANTENFVEESVTNSENFIKAVKYMLVGVTSEVFPVNNAGLFYLKKNICVEGLSHEALTSYCSDLIFCGSCYRSLNNLCVNNSYKSNENHGFVFKELCESVKRYLVYYRDAALSFPDSAGLLTVHSHMRELRQPIGALARICGVPPAATTTQQRLLGAQLLDYIYKEINETVNRNLQLVLYAAFYPCCQIYFSRFLQRWLFEGVLVDPYEEFIVKSESNYIKSRARVYWTRSFSLRHGSVPEFLSDLKMDILQCGKTMNLLKQCNPDAALYTHIMSRSLPLISCCLTPDQNQKLEQEIDCYYVEMSAICGPRVSLYHRMRDRYGNEENAALLSLVEKKRALAFKEIELRKQFAAEEKAKVKRKIFEEMREQMQIALEQKKKAMEDELKEELLIAEQAAQIEELRSKLIKQESKLIINYYNNLIEAVDKRRSSMELRKQKLLENVLDLSSECSSVTVKNEENSNETKISGSDSVETLTEINNSEETNENSINKNLEEDTKTNEGTEESKLSEEINEDSINKNLEEGTKTNEETEKGKPSEETTSDKQKNKQKTSDLDLTNANLNRETIEMYNQKNENFLQAQKNRAKVLNLEFGSKSTEQMPAKTKTQKVLTEAQRNKLKVLSSEFDIMCDETPTTSEIIKPSIVFTNESINNNTNTILPKVTSNLASPGHEDIMNLTHRKKILKFTEPITGNDPTPMSVDSTPNTEYSTELPTPSSAKLSLNTEISLDMPSVVESALLTGTSCMTDDGFRFPVQEKPLYENTKLLFANKKSFSITDKIPKSIQPMRVSKKDVEEIKNGNLKVLLYRSVFIPLEAQMKLVNNEIIKCFVDEHNILSHLHSLRCYYFFFDGEFARHITDSLFTKLYDSTAPKDLLSCRSLQLVIDGALHASSKVQENGDKLSFIVRNFPRSFDLTSIEVFECLSLSYKINWPLNIILPSDAIEKYDTVFKYLLKLQHMNWVLQKICVELKNTQKEIGIDETLLFNSPQYHKIQLYRHTMYHFIQTLQNYTVSEVLQTSWYELETNLKNINTLDQLYSVHVVYIKTIMFRCLLNRKCESIMKVIREIFITILKFYNYLRSRFWNLRENDIYYTHPNFKKMEYIFGKFEEFTIFVFRVANKMAQNGYQPHLIQMLDMLNINDYYTSRLNA